MRRTEVVTWLGEDAGDVLGVFVDGGYCEVVRVGEHAVVFYPDGRAAFVHRCDRSGRGAGVVVCGPMLRLGEGHTVVERVPLTIVASILCGDCGVHGFVTAGEWVAA